MPYKDRDKRREYNRAYNRLYRAGLTKKQTEQPRTLINDETTRLESAKDYLMLINSVITEVRGDTTISTIQMARTVGYLVGVGLKALEFGTLEERLSVIEKELQATSKPLNWKTAVV